MPKCSFHKCKNMTSRILKKDGISYFRFPQDPIRREEWISIVAHQRRVDFFKALPSSVVCSLHFSKKDMYITTKGRTRLIKTAVPRIEEVKELTPPRHMPSAVAVCRQPRAAESELKIEKISDDCSDTEVCSPSSMTNLGKKESTYFTSFLKLHTTLEALRKDIVNKELQKYRRILNCRRKIMDSLSSKNSRLVKRNIALKNTIKVLKERIKLNSNLCEHLF